MQSKIKLFSLTIILAMFVSLMAMPSALHAQLAAGYSEYYISGETKQLWDIFNDIDDNPTLCTSAALPDPTYCSTVSSHKFGMHAVISVTASTDNTTIYYDHWEDGYDFVPSNPATADETYTINGGGVKKFEANEIPIPRGTETYYDGRDRIYTAGGPVVVTRASWPESIGTVFALAWEVYPTKPFQNEYRIPVGEDLAIPTASGGLGYDDFKKTYIIIQSTSAGNEVRIDNSGDGSVDKTVPLGQGEVTQYGLGEETLNSNTIIYSDDPVQIQIIVGDGPQDSTRSEIRGYSVVPWALWDNEYYSPVGGFTFVDDTDGVAPYEPETNNTDLYFYNPHSTTITISYQDKTNSGTFTIPAGETRSYSDGAGHTVPIDFGVHVSSSQKFWGIGSADTENMKYDWGYSLVPGYVLTDEYFLGWAPGTSDLSKNGSPVFVTPLENDTTIFVDFDGDGTADAYDFDHDPATPTTTSYVLNRLDSQKVFDTTDNDNSGMHIWATGKIALAWGQDPDTASSASPYLDLGYTTLPLPQEWMDVVMGIDKTASPTSIDQASPKRVTYTLNIPAYELQTDYGGLYNNYTMEDIVVRDSLPAEWTYVAGSTTITFKGAVLKTGTVANPTATYANTPSIDRTTLEWNLTTLMGAAFEMKPNETLEVVYKADPPAPADMVFEPNQNDAEVSGTIDRGVTETFTATDDAYVEIIPTPASIGGTVWLDLDNDSTLDPDEIGLSGIVVWLDLDGDSVRDADEPYTTTNASGVYDFTGLDADTYSVRVDSTTVPTGCTLLSTNPLSIAVTWGDDVNDANFRYDDPGTANISDLIWNDLNANGTMDGAETGFNSINITLYRDNNNNGVFDAGDDTIGTNTTNASGIYPTFSNLDAGYYLIEINTSGTLSDHTLVSGTTRITLTPGQIYETADFGYRQQGTVTGHIFNDLNGNGVEDPGEPPMKNVRVTITDSQGVTRTVKTNGSGNYSAVVPIGSTTVDVVESSLPAGYVKTAGSDPTTVNVTTNNTVSAGKDGYRDPGTASIGDYVWNDVNGDKIQDADEPPLSGVVVYLDLNNNGIRDDDEPSATTNSAGAYDITSLAGGTCTVRVDTSTLPSEGYTLTTANDPLTVNLAVGQDYNDADFGYRDPASGSIGDYVWEDVNGDGVQDADEPGLEGVVVYLDQNGNGTRDDEEPFATTDASGAYDITGLPAGNHTVTVDAGTLPSGYKQTGGTDPLSVELGASQDYDDADFGYQQQASIGDFVWNDKDGDGMQDEDEPGIEGVTLDLIAPGDDGTFGTSDDVVIATQTTTADGAYLFDTVLPGDYIVDVTDTANVLSGYTLTGGADPTSTITVERGDAHLDADFGYRYQFASVGDFVWNDQDGDGVQDVGEPGIVNAEVSLYSVGPDGVAGNDDDVLMDSMKTDANGNYLFTGVPGGTYYADVTDDTIPEGLSISQGSSDPSSTFTLTPGQAYLDADFGYTSSSSDTAIIGDMVWSDADGDGVRDPGEPGIGSVSLDLVSPGPDGLFGTDDDVVEATTSTAADGTYLFTNIPPGKYIVDVTDTGNVLSGYSLTGGADPTAPISVAGGDVYLNADFGYQKPSLSSIEDTAWYDADANENKDDGEPGIPGVTVDLVDDSGVIIATATTDNNGDFSFNGVEDGDYTVVIADNNDKLSEYSGTTPDANAGQRPVTVSGSDVSDEHFGYITPGTIGDKVFSDADGDGVHDPDEAGIAGVNVQLWRDDGDGVFDPDTDTLVSTATTDNSGTYLFTALSPDTYFVSVDDTQVGAIPAWLPNPNPTTTDDETGPNADGTQAKVTLGDGESYLDADFGYQGTDLPDVSGNVWNDLDTDGSEDGGDEPPLSNVTVELVDSDGNTVSTTTTDSNGHYEFPDVPPGDYTIMVTDTNRVLQGYELTSGNSTYPITVGSSDITDKDFGYVRNAETGSVGDYVWHDLDGDGVQDAGEPGLEGVELTLYSAGPDGVPGNGDDIPLKTTTTDASGNYLFTGLPAGTYYVDVTDSTIPDGLLASPSTIDPSAAFLLASGESYLDADFGYTNAAGIGDLVWSDANGDGVRDVGESGIGGVSVDLITPGQDGTFGTDDDVVEATQITAPDGSYLFTDLLPGAYMVDVTDTGSVVDDYELTGGADPTDAIAVTAGQSYLDADFGYYREDLADVSGSLWNDIDADAGHDGETEIPLAGVTLVIQDPDGYIVAETVTDENGNYHFPDVPPGDYTIVVTDKGGVLEGYERTTDAINYPITVGTEDIEDRDFGYVRAALGDYVWRDLNGDGIQDRNPDGEPVEPGMPGVTVRLYDANDELVGTTTTDENGFYGFADLAPGDYIVEFDLPSGYEFSLPAQGGDTDLDSDPDPETGRTGLVTLGSGDALTDVDAGLSPALVIGGQVWTDSDEDGESDGNEEGVSGVSVTLLDEDGNVLAETETDENGDYQFTELEPGDYRVEVDSTTLADDLEPFSDPDDETDSATELENQTEDNLDLDFGYHPLRASLGDTVWNDLDRNGLQDADEPGLPGVTVNLLDRTTEAVIATTTTDASGNYQFTGLAPGANGFNQYVVEFKAPEGYEFTSKGQGGDDALDSDADTAIGRTGVIELAPGENNTRVDAGMFTSGSIGDFVWHDTDQDGIRDRNPDGEPVEPGVPNVKVNLFDSTGTTLLSSTETDANGFYIFGGLPPGDYIVEFELPGDTAFTSPNQGGDDAADSNADTITGWASVTLADGQSLTTADAGLINLITLGGQVWLDGDEDGEQDSDEGIPGARVTILLYDDEGNVVMSTETDEDGNYQFTGLIPGDYRVEVDTSTLPPGTGPLSDPDGDPDSVTELENQSDDNLNLHFGYEMFAASVGDYVWFDTNQDGIQDTEESGAAGVTVRLIDPATDTVLDTTVTNGVGFYEFPEVPPGDYALEFVMPSDVYEFSSQDSGAGRMQDAFDSDADPDTGRTDTFTLSGGDNNVLTDAGIFIPEADADGSAGSPDGESVEPAGIGQFVWYDTDMDGIQDTGADGEPAEPGIAGVQVDLLGPDGSVLSSHVTDGAGFYEFTGLAPGDYSLQFHLPSGHVFTSQHQGDDETVDSDVDSDSTGSLTGMGQTDTITLVAGEDNTSVDAGIFSTGAERPGSIGDFVWYDENRNGIQDGSAGSPVSEPVEPGIPGVQVTLYDSTGTRAIGTAITDGNGFYAFEGLPAGDYVAGFDPPPGYAFTLANQGDDIATDSNADPGTGRASATVIAGERNSDVDTGLYILPGDSEPVETVSLGDLVWLDENGDGVVSEGEGLPDVTMRLYDDEGHLISSTETDADGHYLFSDLPPGSYRVEVDTTTLPGELAAFLDPDGVYDSLTDLSDQSGDDPGLDFGYQYLHNASVGDYVWHDADEDGIQDRNPDGEPVEPGISGIRVELLNPVTEQVIASTTTDSSGFYQFDNLVPGEYLVVFTLPAAYAFARQNQGGNDAADSDVNPATGQTSIITLAPGENNSVTDAGVQIPIVELGEIRGLAWDDLDQDGTRDGSTGSPDGEPLLPGITVNLCDSTGHLLLATTTTDANGAYVFPGLTAGHYMVDFELPDGYSFTSRNQGDDDSLDSDPGPFTGKAGIDMKPGDIVENTDAGFVSETPPDTIMIGGQVWLDESEDGGASEPVELSGIRVILYYGNGQYLAMTSTDPNGNYQFSDLPQGDYNVQVDVSTLPDSVRPISDPDGVPDSMTGLVNQFTDNPDLDFGYQPALASVGDYVWNDANQNGIREDDESGLPNVTVNLYAVPDDPDADPQLVGTTVTSETGYYAFTSVPPGQSSDGYLVEFVLPSSDYVFSPQNMEVTDTADSDADIVSGRTEVFTLSEGEQNMSVDAGMLIPPAKPASIGNFVWNDVDQDGVQDGYESGIPGVTVHLMNSAGSIIATTTTNDSGFYSFVVLEPGDYFVEFVSPPGYGFTSSCQGTDTRWDSNADPATGRSELVTLSSGESNADTDAGLCQVITLGDLVWLDSNNNGEFDDGEGLPDVTLTLYDGNGRLVDTTTTDAEGNYRFTDLLPGDYRVEVDTATLPDDAQQLADPDGTMDSATDLPDQFTDNSGVDFGYGIVSYAGPDLANTSKFVKDINGGELGPGDTVWYAVTIYNAGNAAAADVVYTDAVGPHTRIVEESVTTTQGSVTQGSDGEGNGIRVDIGDIPAGESVVITFYSQLGADTPEGTMVGGQGLVTCSNFPDEATDSLDSLPVNNPTMAGAVGAVTQDTAVSVTQTATNLSGGELNPGDTVQYQVCVTNDGTETAGNLVFSDGVPIYTNLVPGTVTTTRGEVAGYGMWDAWGGTQPPEFPTQNGEFRVFIGDLAPGETAVIDFQVTINEDAPRNMLIPNQGVVNGGGNIQVVTNSAPGSYDDPATLRIAGDDRDIEVYKSVGDHNSGSVNPGDTIEYTVTIINTGEEDVTGIVFHDNPPEGLIAGSVASSQGIVIMGNLSTDPEIEVSVGDLGPGEIMTITFQVIVPENAPNGMQIRNSGWASSNEFPDEPSDDPYTPTEDDPTVVVVVYEPGAVDPPSAYKTASGGRPVIYWEMVWINDNYQDAILVHVEDPIPSEVTYVEGSADADYGNVWYDAEDNRIVWEGELAGNGGEVKIWFHTTVPDHLDKVENRASAIWDQNDNGTWEDELSAGFSEVYTDDPATLRPGDQTAWSGGECVNTLGSMIWYDENEDGTFQPDSEVGINGVRVSLYEDNDLSGDYTPGVDEFRDTVLSFTLDDEPGWYLFENICAGHYVVQIAPANFNPDSELAELLSSPGDSDPDDDISDDDNGMAMSGNGVVSKAISLTPGDEPVDDGDTDPNTNLTLDFGFHPADGQGLCHLSLGSRIWLDANGDSLYQPEDEPGVDGVVIKLYWDTDGSNNYTPCEDQLLGTTTSFTHEGVPGYYRFENLCDGNYIVQIVPANFSADSALAERVTSPGNPDPDNDVASDDNGEFMAGYGVVSRAISLISHDEPVDDGDDDPNTNHTLDFGFYQEPPDMCQLELGNIVWLDMNGDGIYQPEEENSVNDVVVNLYADSDGSGDYTPGMDEFLNTTITATDDEEPGRYVFEGLCDGGYILQIAPENFDADSEPAELSGYVSSPGSSDPNDNTDHDDNGDPMTGHGVVTRTVFLEMGTEPTHDGDDDPNTNLTVDFAFHQQDEPEPCLFRLGDLIWYDANEDGVYQSDSEAGIDGVTILLYQDSNGSGDYTPAEDELVGSMNSFTHEGVPGYYLFDGLCQGDYILQVAEENFDADGVLGGHANTTWMSIPGHGVVSDVILLTNEDVFDADFGFYQPSEPDDSDDFDAMPMKPF